MFDDAKKDLVATGLVEDKALLDESGKVVSEVFFKCDSEQRIIHMDETHHNLAITGDRGGHQAVSYHNPAFQRGASRGVKSGCHDTGVYATNAEGEALPPFYIFDSTAKSEGTFVSRWIGFWVCQQLRGGSVVHPRKNTTAFLPFARADQWTMSCSISTSKWLFSHCIPI